VHPIFTMSGIAGLVRTYTKPADHVVTSDQSTTTARSGQRRSRLTTDRHRATLVDQSLPAVLSRPLTLYDVVSCYTRNRCDTAKISP
jgi:hypothetical protein